MSKGVDHRETVVVIPTRNRSAIAVNAIRSVLDQPVDNIGVMVSDNSTSESERAHLAGFCSALKDPRLRYVSPPQSLSMPVHWDWAIHEALEFYDPGHIIYLTDRMMFRSGALKELLHLAGLYPNKVITYNHDRIVDSETPIRIEQYPGTNKLFEVETQRLSYLYSQAVLHHALPRMLNCIVPRELLDRIQVRFGNVFSSISPDFVFCCRCLDMEDSVLFYDRSLIFHYALSRSNGASVTRGEMTSDNADFTANLPVDNSIRNFATPIPQLITAVNAVFNEYFLYKQQTGSSRFFDVNVQNYLHANAEEILGVVDANVRAEMHAVLLAYGYQKLPVERKEEPKSISFLVRLSSKLKSVAAAPATTSTWLFLAHKVGLRPPGQNRFEFALIDDAIAYARNISRGNVTRSRVQETLLEGRELPINSNSSGAREGVIRDVVRPLLPVSVKTAILKRMNKAKAARLLDAKRRFRDRRRSGEKDSDKLAEGVNLVAYIRGEIGLGMVARGMASAFESAHIQFNVINVDAGQMFRATDRSWAHKEVESSGYDTTIVCVNPDNGSYLRTTIPTEVLGSRYVIGNWFWELPELPDEWLTEFEFVDEVWAASRFIQDAVVAKSPVPVFHIPPVVQLGQGKAFSRHQLNLPEHRYLFLAMFDTNSILQRKNPLGVLRAFKNAFQSCDESVGLVLKFNNSDHLPLLLQEIREESAGWENILILDKVMGRDEVASLLRVCDCFVSLHRSEGFGLGPAEAMSVGKPVILTNWSGNIDYMTHDNSIAIDYELVKLGRDYGPYKANQHWAEPDLEQAAHWMKRIVQDSELARRMGSRAKETIEKQFSPAAVGKLIHQRLAQIRQSTR